MLLCTLNKPTNCLNLIAVSIKANVFTLDLKHWRFKHCIDLVFQLGITSDCFCWGQSNLFWARKDLWDSLLGYKFAQFVPRLETCLWLQTKESDVRFFPLLLQQKPKKAPPALIRERICHIRWRERILNPPKLITYSTRTFFLRESMLSFPTSIFLVYSWSTQISI